MDFQKERVGREILEQDLLWTLERSRRQALPACGGACALGCLGLFREKPLAQTNASASAAMFWLGRRGVVVPRAQTHCPGPGARPPRTRTAAGGRGFLRAPALGDCGIVADGAGRRRPRADCRVRRRGPFEEGGAEGSGLRLPSAAAQPCGLFGLRRTTSSLTGLCFPARRRAGPAGTTSPLRAFAGLAAAPTSPRPRSPASPGRPPPSAPGRR